MADRPDAASGRGSSGESGESGKAARRAERARSSRLGRLPFLYAFALRGTWQLWVVTVVQAVLVLALTLGPVKLLSGSWLPPGAAIVVLAGAFGLQALNRHLNGKAGRT